MSFTIRKGGEMVKKFIIPAIAMLIVVIVLVVVLGDNKPQGPTPTPIAQQHDGNKAQQLSGDAELAVHFIDVGQGDGIYVEAKDGSNMLVDAGTKGAGRNIVTYLNERGVQHLDYVVATHPDADHIGGIVPVLENMAVVNFIDSGKEHTSQTFENMLMLIASHDVDYHVPSIGETFNLSDKVKVEVLYADEHASDNNDASIVLRVSYGDVSFLLTGDAGVGIEKKMLGAGTDVQATILKAGHHGSNTSSSPEFIDAVKPEAVILSYGEGNKYGHPHKEVTDTLRSRDIKMYSTAEIGTIVVETDGINYQVEGKPMTVANSKPTSATNNEAVKITSKDLQSEAVGITNEGNSTVDLTGWQLLSVEGDQVFDFPSVKLEAGKTLYITSGGNTKEGKDIIKWTGKQIWLNSGDAAKLFNAKGEVVSELD